MAKIGIDARCLTGGKRTGVEEYFLNLLPRIFEIDKKNSYVIFFNSFTDSKVDFSWAEKYPNVSLRKFRFPNKLLNFCLWYFGFPKIDKLLGGTDLFFMPNITFCSLSRETKLLLTIHDLSFERYPEFFSAKRRLWHFFINPAKIAKMAKKIMAVSEATAEDLISIYGVEKEKIEVVPNAVSEKFRIIDRNDPKLIEIKEKYNLPYKFIFFLGTFEPRKNIISLVRAFEDFRQKAIRDQEKNLASYKLVLAGGKGWIFEDIFREIENSSFRDDILVLDFIPDIEKEYIYNLASVFVYPSFFEGFGFPPLEALACGVPVITSNNSSLPETVSDAAILVDPDRPSQISAGLSQILSNEELRRKLISRGLSQSKKFSWERNAQRILGILRAALPLK